MSSKKKELRFSIRVIVPYYSYGNEKDDLRFERHIKRYTLDSVRNQCHIMSPINSDDTTCETKATIIE